MHKRKTSQRPRGTGKAGIRSRGPAGATSNGSPLDEQSRVAQTLPFMSAPISQVRPAGAERSSAAIRVSSSGMYATIGDVKRGL